MSFRGHTHRNLDGKGRLMLPPEFKDVILGFDPEGKFMLTNLDGCAVGYPIQEWEKIESSLQQVSGLNRNVRNLQRFILSGAVEVRMDKQARVLLPPHLRDYAKLEKDVILAGMGNKFEIWNREIFEENRKKMEENYENVMQELFDSGIELNL